jgi:hypothetical protein
MSKNKNIEFIDQQAEQKEYKKSSSIKDVIDGSFLNSKNFIGQLPFILFLTFLAILYIANRYHAEKVVRETSKIRSEVKELRAEAITITSKLMNISKQSAVARLVNERGLELKESTEPPIVIKKSKK